MRRFLFVSILLFLAGTAFFACTDKEDSGPFAGAHFLVKGDTIYLWRNDTAGVQIQAFYGKGTDRYNAIIEWSSTNGGVFSVSPLQRSMRGDSCIAYAKLLPTTTGKEDATAQVMVTFRLGQEVRTLTYHVQYIDMDGIHLEGLPEGSFGERVGKVVFYMLPVDADVEYEMGGREYIEYPPLMLLYEESSITSVPYEEFRDAFFTGTRKRQGFNDKVWLNDYFIGQTEVTAALWEAVMDTIPTTYGQLQKDVRSVENVSWQECQEFCQRLSQMTGRHYRLPTGSEWEFAAGGGKLTHDYKYAGSNDRSEVDGTLKLTGRVSTRPSYVIKQCKPNELDIYDMTGNVAEFVSDTLWWSNGSPMNAKMVRTGIPIRPYLYYRTTTTTSPINGLPSVNTKQYSGGYIHISSDKRTNKIGLRIAISAEDVGKNM